jgi:DNA-binding LacI/PurR family transcriptional regulator
LVGRHEIPLEETNEALRVAAFRDVISRAGLDLPDAYVQVGLYHDNTDRPSDGARMMTAFLAVQPRPTAVIVGSDFIAAGVLQAIHEAGLRVPDDISIVGYDDSMAEVLTPRLSTIAQPMEALGKFALDASLASEEELTELGTRRTLETKLVIRASTAAPPLRVRRRPQ